MEDELIHQIKLANIHSDIIHRMGGLLLMYYYTSDKIEESYDTIKWYDKDDIKRNNKDRMKETARMLNGYKSNLHELMIIGISKAAEDLLYEYNDNFELEVDFWKNCKRFEYFKEMGIIRNLNNCIKHSKGAIQRGIKSSDYLIDEIGYPEGSKVKELEIDIEDFIFKSFLFQMDIFWKTQEKENPYLKFKEDYNWLRKKLIPNFIELYTRA
ncbi:hypothetical protein [Aquimarina algiphila]|uniref:Uncharacterized protein n=1 Tax=Aquimarina algiphila TaxID=2047982 RepID=A0A554VBL4_9FLAO|nr:hypothetical protein [Aquimarina algiphila]TSE03935.1 hypothetical protein FOF46_28130 [Aquimarina algiphila]